MPIFESMKKDTDKEKQEEQLKELKKKPFTPEIQASIDKKLKYVNKPINK